VTANLILIVPGVNWTVMQPNHPHFPASGVSVLNSAPFNDIVLAARSRLSRSSPRPPLDEAPRGERSG